MAEMDEIVRVGKVVSIDEKAHTVRVQLPDRGGMVSYDLPVLVSGSADVQDYNLPGEHTDVVCIFLPNGQQQGFILGAYYTEANKPPASNRKKFMKKFSDGTTLEYDRSNKVLTVTADGGITINGNITIKGNLTASGSITDSGGNTNNHSH